MILIKKWLSFIFVIPIAMVSVLVTVSCADITSSSTPDKPADQVKPVPPSEPNKPSEPNDPPATPAPPLEPEKPNQPTEPTPPNEIDPIKHQINYDYLKKIIQINDYGYNPSSFKKTILEYQINKNKDFIDNIFTDKKIQYWNSIKNLKIIQNDKLGSISMSFDYGGTNTYKIDLDAKHGLLNDAHYYKKIDDLSFSIQVAIDSIISDRKLPVYGSDWKTPLTGANHTTEFNEKANVQATYKNDGVIIEKDKDGAPGFVKTYRTSGTAWLVDYLPSDDANADFYEFVIATNLHVSNITDGFHFYPIGGPFEKKSIHVPLDPISIRTSWNRRAGNKNDNSIDYENINDFNPSTKIESSIYFPIKNLSFNREPYQSIKVNQKFANTIMKNADRLNKDDKEVFDSWDHPISEKTKNEKNKLMKDFNFYNPTYKSKFQYKNIDPYWEKQLNNQDNSLTYTNIQPDLVFLKAQFQKSDLKQWWPTLYKNLEDQTIEQLLIPLTTKIVKPEDYMFEYENKKEYVNPYYGGYPSYRGTGSALERENGYNEKIDSGTYFRMGKIAPHLEWNDFNYRWPNNLDYDLENEITARLSAYLSRYVAADNQNQGIEDFKLYFDLALSRNYWAPWNEENVNQALKKYVPIYETNSDLINNSNQRETEIVNKERGVSEYFASSPSRGMIQKTINATKKYIWNHTEYLLGGASGSIIISPKMEIIGITSSYDQSLTDRGIRNIIFEGVVNCSPSIISGDLIIKEGLINMLKSLNIYSTLYNKK